MDELDDDGQRHVVWDRREAWWRYQQYRVLAVTLGDAFVSAARAFAALDPKHRRRAAGLLVRACDQYQQAGLSRRARACWRLARFMHRAAWGAR